MEALNENRIRELLGLPDVAVEVHAALPSTMGACRRLLDAGAARCLVLAETQSGGRGRRSRSFFSPPGGLYLSVGFPAAGELAVTCRAAVAAAEAVEAVAGRACGIKWVNDLYYEGKKVCGILAETAGEGVIVGIGVNLIPAPLPPELAGTVGFLDCGDVREALAAASARHLLANPVDADFMDAYRRRSVVLGRDLTCTMGEISFPARALAIDDAGSLVVRRPDGVTETLRWGEVSIRL